MNEQNYQNETPGKTLATLKGVGYTLGTIALVVVLFLWYINNNYSFVYNNNFMRACQAGGASKSSCQCALSTVKDNYSFKEAKGFEEDGVYPQELLNNVSSRCG
jgi:hypothetical protein